jgi:DNA mismatch repair protein MutL
MEGYRTYLLKGRYPAAVLFLELAPEAVDVNVHPSKLEVRFADAEAVRRFVAESVTATLRGAASPLGRWGLTEDDFVKTDSDLRRRRASAREFLRADVSAIPVSMTKGSAVTGLSISEGAEIPGYTKAPQVEEHATEPIPVDLPLGSVDGPAFEVVGQVFAGYIICQAGEELVLLDQHAAHERILYERIVADYERGPVVSQPLLLAETVSVGGDAVEAFERAREELERLGWQIEAFGDEDVVVRSVPAIAAGRDHAVLVERLAAELTAADASAAGSRLAREVAASVACHAAVRVGKVLDRAAARALIEEIGTVDFASSCPHGRPVAHVLSRASIERMFGR